MSSIQHDKNCHEYCPNAKYCRYLDGDIGIDYEECAMYYKIDDLLMEARDIAKEERKARGEDDGF